MFEDISKLQQPEIHSVRDRIKNTVSNEIDILKVY